MSKNKKKKSKDYEKLTLREIIGWMKTESEIKNEPLTGEKLGSLTLRNIVEKARQYSVKLRRNSCNARRPRS